MFRLIEVGDAGPETDLVGAYRQHKTHHGAGERKNCSFALHLIAIVSPMWLEENPDLKDKRRNALIEQAVNWANEALGPPDVVFAARYDVNEEGKGAVDIFAAPVRDQRLGRGRKLHRRLAPNQALDELAERHSQQKGFAALQDSWSQHAKRTLDPRLQRGEPKTPGKNHLTPEAYKAKLRETKAIEAAEDAEADARLAKSNAEHMEKRAEALAEQTKAEQLAKARMEAATERARLDKAKAEKQVELARAKAEAEARETELAKAQNEQEMQALIDRVATLRSARDELIKSNETLITAGIELKSQNSSLRGKLERLKQAMKSLRATARGLAAIRDIVNGAEIARELIRPTFDLVRKTILPAIQRAAKEYRVELGEDPGLDRLR